jgi:transposase-like protein
MVQKRRRRSFSAEFKAKAVKKITSGKRSPLQVEREHKLSPGTIYNWLREAKVMTGETNIVTRSEAQDSAEGQPAQAAPLDEQATTPRKRIRNRTSSEHRTRLQPSARHSTAQGRGDSMDSLEDENRQLREDLTMYRRLLARELTAKL